MKPYKSLLPHPDDISDEAAAVLTEFLYYLAGAADLRYMTKIRRHADVRSAAAFDRMDPDRPWCRRPPPAS
jgi:hypothetical protein